VQKYEGLMAQYQKAQAQAVAQKSCAVPVIEGYDPREREPGKILFVCPPQSPR
jgi:hypothetical protein